MFKKRKTAAPYFRMPSPTNPILGSSEYLYPPLKQYTRFKLLEALTTSDKTKTAEITDAGQWGPNPIFHTSEVDIHVHNQLADDDTTYLFTGEIGDVGIALHDHTNHWRIVWMVPTGGGGNAVATTATIIPARSGTTPGGPISVTKKKLDDLVTPTLVDDGVVDVYSWVKTASSDPADEDGSVLWIFIEQDAAGVWWFTGQDCPPELSV